MILASMQGGGDDTRGARMMFSDVDYARQIGKGFRFQFMTVEKGFFAVC